MSADEPDATDVWSVARRRGVIYEDCGRNTARLLQGWLDLKQDPETQLFSRGRTWDYHNEAADHYSSLVLIARHVKPAVIAEGGALHKTLTRSGSLCRTSSGLPTTYNLKTGQKGSPARPDQLAEWLRDGLLRIVEVLGTENDWHRESERLTNALISHARAQGGLNKVFQGTEDAGNMLQSLTRLYAMSGREAYLTAAEEMADHWLLAADSRLNRVTFGDHGCELVPGLGELFALECQLDRPKAKAYREPLRRLLDRILETGAHPTTGLFCSSRQTEDGSRIWGQPSDTWGYVLFTYENYDRGADGNRYADAIRKPLAWLAANADKYNRHRKTLWPRARSSDDWSDSYESFIVLWNRYPSVPGGFAWLDWATRQHIHRRHDTRQYGPYTGGHFDGSTGRTLCLHMMLCSQGVRALPFREGLRLGAVQRNNTLHLTLEREKDWTGKLLFDPPRTEHEAATLNWARINEMPRWFVARPQETYRAVFADGSSRVVKGEELINGLEVTVEAGDVWRLTLRPAKQ